MQEKRARRIVDELRDHGTDAQLEKSGVYQFGIRIKIPGGREAIWDSDGTAGLEAQVMRDGMLVGFVPSIAGSEDFDDEQVVDVITRTTTTSPSPLSTPWPRPPPHRSPYRRGVPAIPRRFPIRVDVVRAKRLVGAAYQAERWARRGHPGPACVRALRTLTLAAFGSRRHPMR